MCGQVKQISVWLGLYHRTLFWQGLDSISGRLVCFYVDVDIFQDECRKTCLTKYPCMCRCSLTVLIFEWASHAVLLVCQSTSNVIPIIRNRKDCYSFPVFKAFLPQRNCCSRFYQCWRRLIQNTYLKNNQSNDCSLADWVHQYTECSF